MQDVEVEVLVDKMFAGDKTDEIAFRGKRRYLNKLERLSMDNIAKQAMKTMLKALLTHAQLKSTVYLIMLY